MKTNNTLVGILGGVVVGAALGVLFAPDKGTNTRRKLKSNANDLKGDLKSNFDDFIDNIADKYQNIVHSGSDLLTEGKAKLNTLVSDFNAEVDKNSK